MSSSKVVFDLGKNKHGQPIHLELLGDGTFSLLKEPANQRDEAAKIFGLTRDQIAAIGRAAHVELGVL